MVELYAPEGSPLHRTPPAAAPVHGTPVAAMVPAGAVVAAPASVAAVVDQCAAYAADPPGGAETVTASEGGFRPLAKEKAVLDLAPTLAECESAVCNGLEDGVKLLSAKLSELRAVQERLRDQMVQTEGIVDTCNALIEDGKDSVALYDATFKIVSKGDAIGVEEYKRAAAAAQAKCEQCAIECRQGKKELAELYEEAVAARPAARAAMEALNNLSRAQLQKMGPLKRMSRASEKMVLEPGGGTDSAERICDIVRDMFECASMSEVAELLWLIVASPTIEIVRFKDRVANPSGGWRDAMINYRVRGSTHINELQIVHNKLLLMRKDMGGHETYSFERNAREVLEYMGKQCE